MRHRRFSIFLASTLTVSMLGLSACGTTSTGPVQSTSVSAQIEKQQAQVEQIAASVNKAANAAGYLVGVWQPGQPEIFVAGGQAKREQNYRIASITKTFTATTVVKLAEQGKLSLDDPVQKFVPGLPNGSRITVRMVLNMTSGLPSLFKNEKEAKAYVKNPNLPWTVERSLNNIRQGTPAFAPGADCVYENSNYIVAGRIIEAVTGESAGDVIRSLVIEPAGLDKTFIPNESLIPAPAMPGTVIVDGQIENVDAQNPQVPFTAGNIISTIDQLRAWSPQLASSSLLNDEFNTAQQEYQPMGDFGYGLGVYSLGGWLGHTGAIPGYVGVMVTDPKTQVTFVTMSLGGPMQSPAAQAVFAKTVATLWPGQYPAVDRLAAQMDKAMKG